MRLLVALLWQMVGCECAYHVISRQESDCLQDHLTNSLTPAIVEYCIRPMNDDSMKVTVDILNTRDRNYTFEQLARKNVTAVDVLRWSSSIDLAERYQQYVNEENTLVVGNELFFNCTAPWFGSRCEYSLQLDEDKSLFNPTGNVPSPTWPCYTLLECDRGGSLLCLDWREICDGRIDCLNGGVDEKDCFQLEMNECAENEYRCHNGLCISRDFWMMEYFSAECLDQSDLRIVPFCPRTGWTPDLFECEENTCRPGSKPFVCGDGECVDDFEECTNGRHLLVREAMTSQGNLSYHCWIAMLCLTKLIDRMNETDCVELLQNSSMVTQFLDQCESVIQFPVVPVLFGHIRFFYRPKNISTANTSSVVVPSFVCYDERLCSFLRSTSRIQSYTCQEAARMGLNSEEEYDNWKSLIDRLKPSLDGCLRGYDQASKTSGSSLFLCKNSSKFISKHRILDGISDCYLNDDEEDFRLSCALNDPDRFQCANEVQCRSPLMSPEVCSSISEAKKGIDDIFFNQICDGVTDLVPQLSAGEHQTDQTHCEGWPCANVYSRCDGFWNCPNGEDEENCDRSSCPAHSLACISPWNWTVICLEGREVNNGIVNCVGGIDELPLCRISDNFEEISYRYHCLNDTSCVSFSDLCDLERSCPLRDDKEIICRDGWNRCDQWTWSSENEMENILCRVAHLRHVVFTLKSSEAYPMMSGEKKDWPVDNIIDVGGGEPLWKDTKLSSRCVRGIGVYLWLGKENYTWICFCPRNYYGRSCEFQDERVSVTLRLLTNKEAIYALVVKLISRDIDGEQIHSYDQLIYCSNFQCQRPLNTYLSYSERPKNPSKNYSIHIDAYEKDSLEYLASWHAKIAFAFLPVNRVALTLALPASPVVSPHSCPLQCFHGVCLRYVNEENFFCRCQEGWSDASCGTRSSNDDRASTSNSLCPLGKFGLHCRLKYYCPVHFCANHGRCVVIDQRMVNESYFCLCPEEFHGRRCEKTKARLHISFNRMEIPSHAFIYIYSYVHSQPPSVLETMMKKLTETQKNITLYLRQVFQIVFVKMSGEYYLAVLSEFDQFNVSSSIDASRRCPSINELLTSEELRMPRIRQVKFYHRLCASADHWKCFVDNSSICLCTTEDYPNCFAFNHQTSFWCDQRKHCLNGGECLQDQLSCPLTTICVCNDCFYGDRCQFYGKGIGLTLHDILRTSIEANVPFGDQSRLVKVSAMVVMIIFVVGLIDGVLALLAFRSDQSRQVGCGIYLYASSISAALTVMMLAVQFWFVVFSQIHSSIDRAVLRVGCLVLEPILKLCLHMGNWLNACVAAERAVHVFKGVKFDKRKSQRVARWLIVLLPVLITSSNIWDSRFRDLFDDHEEHRVWCVTLYSPSLHKSNTVILFFHFLTPFCLNLFSALFIILAIARQRAEIQTHHGYYQHLHKQFSQHKQLIISPLVLVALSLPLFIISLLSGCVKTSRDSWLYLLSYFISFIPPSILFIIFVLPSDFYRKTFKRSINDVLRRYGLSSFRR